eukprot:3669585-Rhodomonas_salina.1
MSEVLKKVGKCSRVCNQNRLLPSDQHSWGTVISNLNTAADAEPAALRRCTIAMCRHMYVAATVSSPDLHTRGKVSRAISHDAMTREEAL